MDGNNRRLRVRVEKNSCFGALFFAEITEDYAYVLDSLCPYAAQTRDNAVDAERQIRT